MSPPKIINRSQRQTEVTHKLSEELQQQERAAQSEAVTKALGEERALHQRETNRLIRRHEKEVKELKSVIASLQSKITALSTAPPPQEEEKGKEKVDA